MKLLLDTNAYTAMKRGHPGVVAHIRAATALCLSTVVVGELLHGFRHGQRYAANVAELEALLDHPLCSFAGVDWDTAVHFARIAADLRRIGRPIPSNDIWIAAQCWQQGATLLTSDGDFAHVAGLAWVRFAA